MLDSLFFPCSLRFSFFYDLFGQFTVFSRIIYYFDDLFVLNLLFCSVFLYRYMIQHTKRDVTHALTSSSLSQTVTFSDSSSMSYFWTTPKVIKYRLLLETSSPDPSPRHRAKHSILEIYPVGARHIFLFLGFKQGRFIGGAENFFLKRGRYAK